MKHDKNTIKTEQGVLWTNRIPRWAFEELVEEYLREIEPTWETKSTENSSPREPGEKSER